MSARSSVGFDPPALVAEGSNVMRNQSTLIGTTSTELRALGGLSDLGSAVQLRRVIQRRLGDAAADLLADPQVHENGAAIDWYAGWSGEVRRLADLTTTRRAELLEEVDHVLGDIAQLGKILATSSAANDAVLVGKLLQLAARYPSDDFVFLVGDRPAIMCWGYGADAAEVLPATPLERVQESPSSASQPEVTPTTVTALPRSITVQGSAEVAKRRSKIRLSVLALIPLLLLTAAWFFGDQLAVPLSHMIDVRKEVASSGLSEAYRGTTSPPETLCDTDAAHPFDPGRLGLGQPFEKIDASKAIPNCIDALARYPDSARLQFQLGRAYNKNNQMDLAAKWYRLAADQGYGQAQSTLGYLYQGGQGVPLDYAAAVSWYRKAADQGLASGQTGLGVMYQSGQGVPQDYATAVSWYRLAADQGYGQAQFNLGVMYWKGQGVPQDYAAAVSWFRKAADQGLAVAQFNLGVMYENGQGVPADYAAAVSWYRKAADQGSAAAQNNLASAFYKGQGVPQNYATAAAWYRKAADSGLPEAQSSLGQMYADGQGVPQSFATAIEWLRRAADQSDFKAQNKLGHMYAKGQGVPQDDGMAASWYRKAAEQGNAAAQANLGGLYFNGQGVPRDYVQAYKWLNLAVSRSDASEKSNFEVAIYARDEAMKRMTPAQIAEAQKLAREWKPKLER
jgi:TPR repeat protein